MKETRVAGRSAAPDSALTIFVENGRHGRAVVTAQGVAVESGRAGGRRVETAEAGGRGAPVDAPARFEEIVDEVGRQALLDAVVGELVTVEAGETLGGAESEKAPGVLFDAQDVIAGQAVGRRVGLDRQPARVKERRRKEQSGDRGEQRPHGRFILVDVGVRGRPEPRRRALCRLPSG